MLTCCWLYVCLFVCLFVCVCVSRTLRKSWSYRSVWSRKQRLRCGCWRKTVTTNTIWSHHSANNLKMSRTSTSRCTIDFRSAVASCQTNKRFYLKKPALTRVQNPQRGKPGVQWQVDAGSDAGKAQSRNHCLCSWALRQGKPSMAYVFSSSGNNTFCLKTDTDIVILTFWPQNKWVSKTHHGTFASWSWKLDVCQMEATKPGFSFLGSFNVLVSYFFCYRCMFALLCLFNFFQYLAVRLAGKNVSEMIYFVSALCLRAGGSIFTRCGRQDRAVVQSTQYQVSKLSVACGCAVCRPWRVRCSTRSTWWIDWNRRPIRWRQQYATWRMGECAVCVCRLSCRGLLPGLVHVGTKNELCELKGGQGWG